MAPNDVKIPFNLEILRLKIPIQFGLQKHPNISSNRPYTVQIWKEFVFETVYLAAGPLIHFRSDAMGRACFCSPARALLVLARPLSGRVASVHACPACGSRATRASFLGGWSFGPVRWLICGPGKWPLDSSTDQPSWWSIQNRIRQSVMVRNSLL